MPFLVRYHDPAQGHVVEVLAPRPTVPQYPETRLFKSRPTKDNATVIQRPLADNRERKWVWKRYRNHVGNYLPQWTLLRKLECKARWAAGCADPCVEVWEDESDEGGFNGTTDGQVPDLVHYTNIQWTRVKILQVSRTLDEAGGPAIYAESTVTFVVEDDRYTSF